MRRPAFAALCAASALTIGIVTSVGRTALSAGADDQALRPLSKVPPVERFGQAALDAQSEFLRRMSGVQINYGENGAVREVKGHTGVFLPSGLATFQLNQPDRELLTRIGPALLAAGTEELRPRRIVSSAPRVKRDSPERTIKFAQYIRGLEVQGASLVIWLNIQTNEIVRIAADFLPDYGLPREPKFSAAQARAKVEAAIRESVLEEKQKIVFEESSAPRLAYAFEDTGDTGGTLVWLFQATRDGESLEVVVSAVTGEVMRLRSLVNGLYFPLRLSYTANNTTPTLGTLPNGLTFTFGEGGSPPDTVAAELYNTAGTTFDVYAQIFDRNSWDAVGGPLKLVTHYATNQFPALWYGSGFIIIAENQSVLAHDVDAVAHEFAHGIHLSEGGQILSQAPDGAPALAEAFGDWGATVADVKLHSGVVSPSTWQISTYRNLQAPNTMDLFARDWFPTRSFMVGPFAGGTAHRNSTIMGHALYLLAMGGQHYRAGLPGSEVPVIPVTAVGYSVARDIFYDAIETGNALSTNATFFSLRNATVQAALNPAQQTSVQQAWNAVGVGYNCSTPPQVPQWTVTSQFCRGLYDIEWPSVPGATRYDGQVTQANLGWAFAQTIVDGNVNGCHQDLPPTTWMARLRACNGCGCSAWTATEFMPYWNQCQ